MSRQKTRRENLKRLIAEYGTISALAEVVDTSEKYLGQLIRETQHSSGRTRTLGDELADRIESACGLPQGWLDTIHGQEEPKLSAQEFELVRRYRAGNAALKRALLAVARLV